MTTVIVDLQPAISGGEVQPSWLAQLPVCSVCGQRSLIYTVYGGRLVYCDKHNPVTTESKATLASLVVSMELTEVVEAALEEIVP